MARLLESAPEKIDGHIGPVASIIDKRPVLGSGFGGLGSIAPVRCFRITYALVNINSATQY
jgi:hypothetical protein